MWTLEKMEGHVRWVRDALATGTLPGELAMMSTMSEGTVGCIGGWARWRENTMHPEGPDVELSLITGLIQLEDMERGIALHHLFFDWHPSEPTTEQVIAACDRWLSGNVRHPWHAR